MADHLRTAVVVNCLNTAATSRDGNVSGVTFHSDHDFAYTTAQFADYFAELGICRSLGRTGICWGCEDHGCRIGLCPDSYWDRLRALVDPSICFHGGEFGGSMVICYLIV